MYRTIEKYFSRKTAGRLVVEAFLRHGFSVDGKGKILAGNVELAPAKIGRALGVDRRVVIGVARQIAGHGDLLAIFGRLQPRAFIGDSAKRLGFDSIEISADAHAAGVVATVSKILAEHKVAIRQMVADDPDLFPEPKLNIVVDGRLSNSVLNAIRKSRVAEKIAIK